MKKYSPYRWVILLFTVLPCFMMTVCQFQATPYAAELMQKLSLNEQQYATIATAPMLVGVFISFLSGTLADRFGVKKTVFVAMIITTVGALCRAFAPSYGVLLLVTILMGVAGVTLSSNQAKLMSAWFKPEELGLAIGLIISTGNSGTILAMLIGKGLSPDVSVAFLYGGIAFAVLTVCWLLFIKERKSEAPDDAEAPEGAELPKAEFGKVLKCKRIWLAAVAAAFYMGVNVSVSALLSPGLVARGVSDGAAALTVIVFSLTALIGSVVMPGVISRQAKTKVLCACLAIVAGVTLYFAWKSDSPAARNILVAVCGFALGGLLPTLMSFPVLLPEIGPESIGAAGGLISTVLMAGAFLLPSYVITPLAGGINDTAFLVAALCAVVLAVLFLILPHASARKD